MLIANWKMFGSRPMAHALLEAVVAARPVVETVICPPFPLLETVRHAIAGSPLALGAQDCHPEKEGAFTGDVSASMLKEAGCAYVIVGHSERRAAYSETDALVARKASAAIAADLQPIICVGESWHERQAGMALSSVLEGVHAAIAEISPDATPIIAYEPIWAIGSGRIPSLAEVAEMHQAIHQALASKGFVTKAKVLYGGSVKPENASDLLRVEGVDGFLVGGASLKAESLLAIAAAFSDGQDPRR